MTIGYVLLARDAHEPQWLALGKVYDSPAAAQLASVEYSTAFHLFAVAELHETHHIEGNAWRAIATTRVLSEQR